MGYKSWRVKSSPALQAVRMRQAKRLGAGGHREYDVRFASAVPCQKSQGPRLPMEMDTNIPVGLPLGR